MNGYQTTILEMADTPGGLCTSWKRKGYTFDGSVAVWKVPDQAALFTACGGITTAAKSARNAIQYICKRDGVKFVVK